MDTYRKTLFILKDILHQSGNRHWESWIDKDIYEWDNFKNTSHHKSAFGGMGSINDIVVGRQAPIGCWQNNLFDYIKNISWTFSAKNKIQIPTANVTTISATVCNNCSYVEITDIAIEDYISKRILPKLITEYLPGDNYLNLTDFNHLLSITEVVNQRHALRKAIEIAKTHYVDNQHKWTDTCPKCNTKNMRVFYFDVIEENENFLLTNGPNNVMIKKDSSKVSFWKRLLGYS